MEEHTSLPVYREEEEDDQETETHTETDEKPKERIRKESKFSYHTFTYEMEKQHSLPFDMQPQNVLPYEATTRENEAKPDHLRGGFSNLEARASIKRLEFKHTSRNYRRSLLYIDDTPDSLLDEDGSTFSPQSVGKLVGGSSLPSRPGGGGGGVGGGGGGKEEKEEVRDGFEVIMCIVFLPLFYLEVVVVVVAVVVVVIKQCSFPLNTEKVVPPRIYEKKDHINKYTPLPPSPSKKNK